jgi:transcriptional regulator with XRE-family HTH domain
MISAISAAVLLMDETEARNCVDSIKNCLESARSLLLDLEEREGWRALGYSSWRECVTAEFEQTESYLYRELTAAKIEREISPIGEIGLIRESHLRPLSLVPSDDRKAVWQQANDAVPEGGKLTYREVKTAVDIYRDRVADEELANNPEPIEPTVISSDRADTEEDRRITIQQQIGQRILERRTYLEMSRRDLAKAIGLGYDHHWLQRVEMLGQEVPIYVLPRLNRALQIPANQPYALLGLVVVPKRLPQYWGSIDLSLNQHCRNGIEIDPSELTYAIARDTKFNLL